MRLGHGVGLRTRHYREFLEGTPQVDWVEAISENFMGLGGRPLAVLEKVRRDRPVVLHGVSLAIGSVAPLDEGYLAQLKALVTRIQPALVSDHLCWGRAHGRYAHDLLPLPFTEEALNHVVARVKQVQETLDRQILLENVSSYLAFKESELTEWEFLSEVARRADCGILLDVNNIYVSARNHGFDAREYLEGVPVDRVQQFHLAGHQDRGTLVIDTHEGHVVDAVWELYRHAIARFGAVPSLIEWDEGIPELPVLLEESRKAKEIMQGALAASRKAPTAVPELPVGRPTLPRLPATQRRVFDWVVGEEAISGAQTLVHGGALSADERVGVYAEMYWLRMRDMLREDHARVLAQVGEEAFDGLVADYIRAFPSKHHSLNEVGRSLPAFLRQHPDPERPWLGDLAALERARLEAFVAPDAPVLELRELQTLVARFASSRLVPAPALRLLGLKFDVATRPEPPEAPPEARPCHLLVWRKGLQVFQVEVRADEADAVHRLLEGQALPEMCEAFSEREDPAAAAFTAIASWVSEGMISELAER
jgi:uncharacterized protein (UPF0276 family)